MRQQMTWRTFTLEYTIIMEPTNIQNKSYRVHNVAANRQTAAVKIIKSALIKRKAEAWRLQKTTRVDLKEELVALSEPSDPKKVVG